MRQDLFYIPHEWLGVPVFGAGWLLILWAIAGATLLAYLWRRQGWNADTRSYVPLLVLMGLLIWLVLPRLEDISDVGSSAGLPIRGYGVMLLLGVKGRSLDEHQGMLVTPAKAYFSVRERAVFDIQVPEALKLFKATHGNGPRSHDEFMAQIIEANQIQLPELAAGQRYVYDPEKEELQVERPAR